MNSAPFQSLSRAEAIQMHKLVGDEILKAFEVGMNMMLQNYDEPFDVLFEEFKKALAEIGFENLPISQAAGMLTIVLKERVVKEEADD
jgi:hypothetical protein